MARIVVIAGFVWIREHLAAQLIRLGHVVKTADSLSSLSGELSRFRTDVVVADVSEREYAKGIRRELQNIPGKQPKMILSTSLENWGLILSVQADGYVMRSFFPEALYRTITDVLDADDAYSESYVDTPKLTIALMSKSLDLQNPTKLNKGNLIKEIQRAEGNSDCFERIPDCGQDDCLCRRDCCQQPTSPAASRP